MEEGKLIFTEEEANQIITKLNFEKGNGLIPVITQDYENDQILMLAYANKTSIKLTLTTGYVHYWSRSRNELWKKGSTSGHLQLVKEIYIDCDADALLIKIEQIGAACHLYYRSCFFRKAKNNDFEIILHKMK
ncbi:MAG: phosphoribosyl-AMP cyclohydrolase [Candidatus Lokiarchaeota archaeon]|nr:phosphoribosyl-AMP cyclohydrolase [Candidatus Lokiarchaeota archaeon]